MLLLITFKSYFLNGFTVDTMIRQIQFMPHRAQLLGLWEFYVPYTVILNKSRYKIKISTIDEWRCIERFLPTSHAACGATPP